MTAARQTTGRLGEELAAAHYARLGYEVLFRNERTRFGEIDLIATDGTTLVFCEVKARRAGTGSPWESLTEFKQAQVRRMACHWLADHPERPYYPAVRFDAIGVVLDAAGGLVSLDHLEGAF